MTNFLLRIYIARGTSNSARVIKTVQDMIDTNLGGQADVVIIDVLTDPEAAEAADVLVTPTIDRVVPQPLRRVVGAPSSAAALAHALFLTDLSSSDYPSSNHP